MFYSQVVRPEKVHKKYSQETKVEPYYMTSKKRIEQMILAGERLHQYKSTDFDFPDGQIDESFVDKTRMPGYDMADATQDLLHSEEVMTKLKNASKEKAANAKSNPDTEHDKNRSNDIVDTKDNNHIVSEVEKKEKD